MHEVYERPAVFSRNRARELAPSTGLLGLLPEHVMHRTRSHCHPEPASPGERKRRISHVDSTACEILRKLRMTGIIRTMSAATTPVTAACRPPPAPSRVS